MLHTMEQVFFLTYDNKEYSGTVFGSESEYF